MANVSQVGGVPDDEAISNAEAAAQLAIEAAEAAQAAQAAAEQAAADAAAAVASQTFADHFDANFTAESDGDYIIKRPGGWANEQFDEAISALSDVDTAGIVDGQSLIWVNANGQFEPANVVNPADYLELAGGTMTGVLTLDADPAGALDAATKAYVDAQVGAVAPYDIGLFFDGIPVSGEDFIKFVAVRDYYLPEDLVGSVAKSSIAATAQFDVDVMRNGVSIGTIRWAASATVATFIFAADINFVSGDILRIHAPGAADATIEDISITLDAALGSIA